MNYEGLTARSAPREWRSCQAACRPSVLGGSGPRVAARQPRGRAAKNEPAKELSGQECKLSGNVLTRPRRGGEIKRKIARIFVARLDAVVPASSARAHPFKVICAAHHVPHPRLRSGSRCGPGVRNALNFTRNARDTRVPPEPEWKRERSGRFG